MSALARPAVRTVVPIAAGVAVLGLGAVAERNALDGGIWGPWLVGLDAAVGVVTVLAGVAAWLLRADSRVGPALVGIGALWFPGAFGYGRNMDLVDFVGFPLQGWHDILLVALLVAVTPGGLTGNVARAIVWGGLLAHLGLALARLLLRPPIDPTTCFCIGNRITGIVDPLPYDTAVRVTSVGEAAFAVAALGLVVVRWRRSSGPVRRTVGLLLATGVAAVVVVTYNRLVTRAFGVPVPSGDTPVVIMALLRITIPLTIIWSLGRGRRARSRVADVVLSLEGRGVDAGSKVLSRALDDPSVRLLRWSGSREVYVDTDGRAVALPPAGAPHAATRLERDGMPLGAIVHDAGLLHEPELLRAVASAARLALHNERLADEVRARLDDVQASRLRIVEAGDEERRRLERDLHDGAQQRLVALSIRLRALEQRVSETGNIVVADELDRTAEELNETIRAIREMVRGIRPPVLAESGLPGALLSLADRAPIPVSVDDTLAARPAEVVEAALYFVASEALTNVLKHAHAPRAEIELRADGSAVVMAIRDGGCGGAGFCDEGGLRGLRDRVEALGGSLTLVSPPGGGTTVVARIPDYGRPHGLTGGAARR